MKKRSTAVTTPNVVNDVKENNDIIVNSDQLPAKPVASQDDGSQTEDQVEVVLGDDTNPLKESEQEGVDVDTTNQQVSPVEEKSTEVNVTELPNMTPQEYMPPSLDALEVTLEESLLLSAMMQDFQSANEEGLYFTQTDLSATDDLNFFMKPTSQEHYPIDVPTVTHLDFDDYDQMNAMSKDTLSSSDASMLYPQISEPHLLDVKALFKNLKASKKPTAITFVGEKHKASMRAIIQMGNTKLTVETAQPCPAYNFYIYFPSVNLVLLQQSDHVNLDLYSGQMIVNTTYQS